MNEAGGAHAACVLVVDDEWLIRWSLGQVLSTAGYRVVEAQDAAEALRHLDEVHGVVAVLLDLKLPDSDGLSVLRRIRALRPDCHVIMMSAHGSLDDMRDALAAGAYRFITKPFEQERVLRLLAEALSASS